MSCLAVSNKHSDNSGLHATNKNFTTQVISVRMASVNQSDVKIATFLTSYM